MSKLLIFGLVLFAVGTIILIGLTFIAMPSILQSLYGQRGYDFEAYPPAYYYIGNLLGVVGIILTSCGALTFVVERKDQHKVKERNV